MQVVSYLRVSTHRQGASGLGLEAQRAAVETYALAGGHRVVAELLEVESGAKADRPQLAAALEICRLHRATLVIAKLDRLARNVAFIANLMDSGTEFIACDMPHANRLTLHLFAAIAEHEREMISHRTKAALAAAKERGARLGNPNGAADLHAGCRLAAEKSARSRAAKMAERDQALAALIRTLTKSGARSSRALALELNQRGITAPRGGVWHASQARRVLTRIRRTNETADVA